MRLHELVWVTLLLVGCNKAKPPIEKTTDDSGSYYQIEGFYLSSLTEVKIGQSRQEIRETIGDPTEIHTSSFRSPIRVPLADIPAFDEQWQYSEKMASNWIFFLDRRVIAAFREASDF